MQDQSGQTQVMQQQPQQQQQMNQQSQMQQQQQQQNQQLQQQAMQVQQQAQQNSMQQQMQSPMQQQPQQQMQQQIQQQQQLQQQPQQMQQQLQQQQQQIQQQPQQMQQQQQLQPQQQLQQQQIQQQQPQQLQGQQLQGPLGSMPVQVQVIQQQPLQNAAYLPQFYNPQNGQIIMPSNLGVNPGGAIQVVAPKSGIFQQAGPHILTQGKQVLAAPGQAASFPGYTTIPTTTNQTLVISQLGVIPSQQNILPAHSAAGQQKQDMQKVQNAQPVQFSSWNFGSLPQSIAWTTSPQQPTLLTTQNANFIRGANPQDASGQNQQQPQHIFIQNPNPQALQHQQQGIVTQTSTGIPSLTPISQTVNTSGGTVTGIVSKPRGPENIQPKTSMVSSVGRPLSNILPSSAIRPASSVSTQTAGQQMTATMAQKQQMKLQRKPMMGRGIMKTDPNTPGKQGGHPIAANRSMILTSQGTYVAQAKVMQQQAQQQLQPQQMQQQGQQPQLISFQQQQISFQPQQQQQPHLIQNRTNQVMSVGMPMTSLQQQLAGPTPQLQQPGQPQVMPVVSMVSNCQPTVTMTNQIPIQSLMVPSQVQAMPSPLPVQSPQQPPTPGTPQKMEITIDGEKTPAPTPSTPSQAAAVDKSKEATNDNKTAPSSTEPPPKMDVSNDSSQVTQNNDSGVTVLEDSNKERGTVPKAMVRPQQTNILTHVIEGYVIQEASQPFPVNRSSDANKENRLKADSNGEPLMKKPMLDEDYGACETCGKVDLKTKYKKKRSCSVCIKNKRNSTGKDGTEKKVNGKESGDGDVQDSGSSGPESSLSSSESNELANQMDTEDSTLSEDLPKSNPLKWTVTEVCEFIKNLPGCYEYAEDFALQEIDGQALMLLKEDHLMSAMSMKLGPALKIVAKIDLMRDVKAEQQSNGGSPEK